jgi:hypothetical protein
MLFFSKGETLLSKTGLGKSLQLARCAILIGEKMQKKGGRTQAISVLNQTTASLETVYNAGDLKDCL